MLYLLQFNEEMKKTKAVNQKLFDNQLRHKGYVTAMENYPNARDGELKLLKHFPFIRLKNVLEVCSGTGFFTKKISEMANQVIASDESEMQLSTLKGLKLKNVNTRVEAAENLSLPDKSMDAIICTPALHHCTEQDVAFEKMGKILKPGGKLGYIDVRPGTPLAGFFEDSVARNCITGHNAYWISDTYLKTLFEYYAGLTTEVIQEVNPRMGFKSDKDVAPFFKDFHAMQNSVEEVHEDVKRHLGIEFKNNKYWVDWQLTLGIAGKSTA